MTQSFIVSCLVFLFLGNLCNAQDSVPVLKGKIDISIKKGTINCDLTLSSIPRISDYVIRINRGMNIRNFRNLDNDNLLHYELTKYDTLATGEASSYYFPANAGQSRFLPRAVRIQYTGAYPVIMDTIRDYSLQDWKGNIAFNGYSLRADGLQTAWYPVLYDVKKDRTYEKIPYDIEVNCTDCKTIYVNGSAPVKGKYARVSSDKMQQLTLFCGSYDVINVDGTNFLNPDLTKQQVQQFGTMINSFKNYYEKKLDILYKDKITFIQTTPTSKKNAWMFVTFPTIVTIGHGTKGMKSFVDPENSDWFKSFMAHELGHYYFGEYARFNSELGDMMNEGFSEFLSLKASRNIIGEKHYQDRILKKTESLRKFTAIPFSSIRAKSDYRNRELYVYYYAPLIFSAIEREIGEELMWKWLRTILQTEAVFTNYEFLEQTFDKTLKDEAKARELKNKYFISSDALANAIKTVTDK